jgi:putative transposase
MSSRAIPTGANDRRVDCHQIDRGKPQLNGRLDGGIGNLRDDCWNEGISVSLTDASRKPALWRQDFDKIRRQCSLDNKTPAAARRALEQSEGSAPGALA